MSKNFSALIVFLAASLGMQGCGKKEAPAAAEKPAASSVSAADLVDKAPAEAPPPAAAEAAPESKPETRPERPEGNLDSLASVTQAIQSFMVGHERPPKDLNELVTAKLLKSIPQPPPGKKFVYTPSKLEIKLVDK